MTPSSQREAREWVCVQVFVEVRSLEWEGCWGLGGIFDLPHPSSCKVNNTSVSVINTTEQERTNKTPEMDQTSRLLLAKHIFPSRQNKPLLAPSQSLTGSENPSQWYPSLHWLGRTGSGLWQYFKPESVILKKKTKTTNAFIFNLVNKILIYSLDIFKLEKNYFPNSKGIWFRFWKN